MAYGEIPYKEGWTKGTNCNSWSVRRSILSKRKSQFNCKLLRKPVHAAQSVCDTDHERRVEARVQALLTTVDENPPVKFPAAPGVPLALFALNTFIYTTEKHERRVLSKLQRGLTPVGSPCQRWNIKIDEGKTQRSTSLEDVECLRTNFN
jgi:hypothetical protein